MFKSKIWKGLQRRGNTKIDSNIFIEKTAPMQITVKKGIYIDVIGGEYILSQDKVISLTDNTDNFIALIYNPATNDINVWHTTDYEALPPSGYFVLQVLVGWNWFIIPKGITDIRSLDHHHAFTWIDNVGILYKTYRDKWGNIVRRPIFYGKGEKTKKKYLFEEVPHFARLKGEGGIFRYCPKCGRVDDDLKIITEETSEKCGFCENFDTVRIKDCNEKLPLFLEP